MSQSIQIQVTQVGLEQSIAAAMKRVGSSAQINLGTNSRQINALSQPLGRITGQADEFTKSMAAANARVLAFGASAGIIAGVSKAMSGLLTSTIKVEKSLTEINSVLNKSGAELDKFGQQIFNVAKNTGKSFDEVASGALELARQGLSAEDTLARLNDALILSRLSGLDAAQSVEGLTAAFNSFQKSGITTAEILNKVVAVSQKYAVSERDIIEGVKRSASVAQQAGVSFDELAAVITAVQQTTARGGAVIGNSFKTIFARIQRKDVLSDLQNMGVAVTDLQGNVLPALRILENLAGQLQNFSQIEQANIAEKLGGVFQLDKLLSALKDLSSEASVTRGALKAAGEAGNSAYEKNIVLNQTLAALLNKVAVNAEQLGAKLGEIGVTDSLKNVLGFFNNLLEGIQKVLGEESGLGNLVRGLVKGLGSFLAGPGLALFGAIILKLSKDLVQFGFASLKAFFGIGKAAKEVQNVEGAISQILAKNVNLQQQLFALEGNRAAQLRVITAALVEQEALLRRSASISSGLAAPLYNVGARATGSGLRVGNSADGYMPAVAKESKAIKQGVGGARAGDKPVVIPNFSFGGGRKGTMVAHTGEYIVPNFSGSGGTAVFNRQMVQSMGLPSGAKKIGAAGGFVPNFVDEANRQRDVKGLGASTVLKSIGFQGDESYDEIFKKIEGKYTGSKVEWVNDKKNAFNIFQNGRQLTSQAITTSAVEKQRSNREVQKAETFYNSNKSPGALMLVPEKLALNSTALNTKFRSKREGADSIFDGFIGGIAGVDPTPDNNKFAKLTNIDNEIASALSKSAVNILKDFDENIKIKPDSALSPAQILKSVLSEGGEGAYGAFKGALFESVIKLVTKAKGQEGGTLDIDFNSGRESLEAIFGVQGKNYQFADLKNSIGQKEKFISQVMTNLPYSRYPDKKQVGAASAASGFIPNFAKYIYDSDRLAPDKGATLAAILASKVKKNLIIGPAGSGKSTYAGKMGQFLSGIDDVSKASEIDILSGAARAKGGISKNLESIIAAVNASGGKVSYLYTKNLEILSRRMGRTSPSEGDLRSTKQLKGTKYAPLNQFDFLSAVKSKARNFNLINGASGFIPNFAGGTPNRGVKFTALQIAKGLGKAAVKLLVDQYLGDGFVDSIEASGLSQMKPSDIKYFVEELKKPAKGKHRQAFENALKNPNTKRELEEVQRMMRSGSGNAAGGFLPNFASPLQDAVNREMAAGVPASQIYIDKSPALKNAANPMGLMVANRRDEPAGGFQGINRARREGANPMMYGAAGGFVPNYASLTKTVSQETGIKIYAGPVQDAIDKFAKESLKAGADMKKLAKQLEDQLKIVTQGNPISKQLAQVAQEEMVKRKEIIAAKALESTAGKKVSSKLDKILQEYNQSEKTAKDLAKAQAKAAAALNKTTLNEIKKSAITSSIGSLAATRPGAQPGAGGNRDMLGTIFAIQGAMTALTGATEGATSGFAKFANSLGSVIGTVSTVAFAGQGLSQAFGGAATSAGKIVGQLGGIATIVTAGISIFKEYTKYVDSTNPSIIKAGEAAGRLAESANKAATNLGNINPGLKNRITKETEESFKRIGYTAQAKKVTGGVTSAGDLAASKPFGPLVQMADYFRNAAKNPGNPAEPISLEEIRKTRATDIFGGLGDDLRNQITESVNQAKGIGVPRSVVDSLIEKYTLQGELNKAGEIQIAAKDGPSLINDLNRLLYEMNLESPESIISKLSDQQAKAFGNLNFDDNNLALENAQRLVNQMATAKSDTDRAVAQLMYEQYRTPESDIYAKILDPLLKKGADPRIAVEIAKKAQSLASERNKAKETEKDQSVAQSPIQLQKAIQAAQREKLEREAIRGIDQQIAKQRNASAIKLAGIETDLTLSASERTIKTLETQAALEKQTAELERQKTIQQKINELSAGIKDNPVLNANPENIKIVQELLNKLKDSTEAQALLTLDKGANQYEAANQLITDKLKTVSGGEALSKLGGAVPQLATLLIDLATAVDSSKQSVADEEAARQKNVSVQKAQTTIQEQNSRLLREAQNNISAIADNYTMQASRVAGQLRLNPAQQELALARYNATTQETDPKKLREGERRILDEFFQKQVALQAKQSQIEAKAEFMRNLKVEENIIQLNDNTKATIENTNAIIESQRAGSFMAGGVEIPVTYEDSLIDEAKLAIDKDLFGPVNNQVKNCAKVVLQFAKSLGVPTQGANDLANSFQNIGTEIENKQSNLKPGDFLINTRGGGPNSQGGHVGMYLGNGKVLQASQSAFDQNPSTKEQAATVTPYVQNQWTMARRSGASVQQATAITAGIGERGYDKAVELSKLTDAQAINAEALKYAKALNISGDAATGLAEQIKNVAIRMREIGVEKALAEEEQRLKNMTADAQTLQETLALSDARSIKGAMERPASTFTEGMQNGFLQLEADSQDFAYLLGKDIPKMFADGMSNAINSAIEGTASLKDALRSAAYEFVKGINQKIMSNLINSAVGNFGTFAFGKGMASGGKVTGGSGQKDDVPAMLMGGEYVVNKKAVSKYGPQFLEAINNGTLSGYAKGGKVPNQKGPQGNFYTPGTYGMGAIEGKKNLLDFATQTGTSGQFDRIVNESGYQAISLEPESSRLSVSGMRNTPMFEATQSAKQQAFDLYLQQYNAEIEAKKQAKAQKKALTTQLLMLAGSAVIGGIGKAAMTGGTNAVKALGSEAGLLDKVKAFSGGLYKGGDIGGGIMGGGLKNLFSGNFGLAYQSKILKASPVSRAIGGMIPSTSGIDTVPAMLSGGEFVMNRSAVQSIGATNLQSMNSGGTSVTSEETSKELNEKLLAKLDELIKVSDSSAAGNITINVSPSGQTTQEGSQDASASRQQLARQIKDAVLQVINEEKRIGGSLRR